MNAPDTDTATDRSTETDERTDTQDGADAATEQEVEEERERRLDPDNRPEGAEVDNTGENMPDFVKGDHSGEGADGTSDPAQAFRDNPPSDEEIKEIEEERERRLAPENRPEGAEVDNTDGRGHGTTDDEPGTGD
ncbi:hypothetical protein H5V45_16460 [Nocardioides sp. KIGAM211]|uniref:Uncharacterized protein n=1 Tax=Nocardioides luti TaxID=2761101 RepID=A0A7X0RIS5_9ACTN|nr:hypothetical protein [Nocardioides luti]MBB6628922.1 hypothetical protein [Nocardioides luti]